MKRTLFVLGFLLIASMLLTACGGAAEFVCEDEIGCVSYGPDEPIHIASMLTISGATAFLGEDSVGAIEIAIADRGGAPMYNGGNCDTHLWGRGCRQRLQKGFRRFRRAKRDKILIELDQTQLITDVRLHNLDEFIGSIPEYLDFLVGRGRRGIASHATRAI